MTTDHTPSPKVAPGETPHSGNSDSEAAIAGLANGAAGRSAAIRRNPRLEPTVAA